MRFLEKIQNPSLFSISDGSKLKHNEILKFIAIISMLIDHIGAEIFPQYPFLRIIGRLAFPLFAYQLAQGYTYTSNPKKYLFRLWIFAIVSQIPFTLYFQTYRLDVLFPFFLSLFLIDRIHNKEWYWIFSVLWIPMVIPMDYGDYGVLMPLVFYVLRKHKFFVLLLASALTIGYRVLCHATFEEYAIIGICIALYFPIDRVRVYMNKYVFYWFYPVHLAVLFLVKMTFFS